MSDRLLRIAALTAAVLSVAAALAALVLTTRQSQQPREAAGAVLISSWSVCGALLVRARPRNALGWLLLLVGVSDTFGAFASTLGTRLLSARPGSDLGLVIAWLGSFYWPIGALAPVTLLLVLYPTGHPPSPRWRPVLIASAAGIALLCLGLAISTDSFDDVVPGARLPFTPPAWVAAVVAGLLVVLLVPSVLISVIGTALRLHRAGQPERQQLSWLILPVTALVLFFFFAGYIGGEVPLALAFAAVPVAVVVGVLRYNLLGIEVVVRRTLVYALLTAGVAAAFAVSTIVLSRVLPAGPAPSFVAAALVAVGLAPARDVLQRVVDRAVYGLRRDPVAVVGQLGRRVGDQDVADLVPAMLAALADALKVPSVAVVDPAGHVLARSGPPHAGTPTTSVALRYAAGEVGQLQVALPKGDALSTADRRLLEMVAPMVAAALHAAALAADLAQARQRVVSVARAERDRLRRDLHDGLGPSLTGMSLGLEAVQTALPADPAAATDVVTRLRVEMRTAVAEIRRILAGLGPGILEERGLADALRHRARTAAEAGGLAVVVTIPDPLPPLPSEIEVAAYRIIDEALTNVVRHATAHKASITVNADGQITLEVSDDGRGLPPDSGDGIGLTSMRRRTQELGGQLLLDTPPGGGTRVIAHLPRTTP